MRAFILIFSFFYGQILLSQDFRDYQWLCPINDVLSNPGGIDDLRVRETNIGRASAVTIPMNLQPNYKEDSYRGNVTLGGFNTLVSLLFLNEKLYYATYEFQSKSKSEFEECLHNWQMSAIAKYGEPEIFPRGRGSYGYRWVVSSNAGQTEINMVWGPFYDDISYITLSYKLIDPLFHIPKMDLGVSTDGF